MKLTSGLELVADVPGEGEPAKKGDRVVYNLRMFLNRGEEVLLNESQASILPPEAVRIVDGRPLVDHTVILGRRETIAGVEKSLSGMRRGGYRKVRAGPHLCYRERGLPGLIPANAVLEIELWVRQVEAVEASVRGLGRA
jgi:FKBP-type peptidyl-prolyl cis-trans isomerase